MSKRVIPFAFFAVAILVSMIREWNAPVACPRSLAAHSLFSSR